MAFEKFTGQAKMPVERISDRDASPNRHLHGKTCRARTITALTYLGMRAAK